MSRVRDPGRLHGEYASDATRESAPCGWPTARQSNQAAARRRGRSSGRTSGEHRAMFTFALSIRGEGPASRSKWQYGTALKSSGCKCLQLTTAPVTSESSVSRRERETVQARLEARRARSSFGLRFDDRTSGRGGARIGTHPVR